MVNPLRGLQEILEFLFGHEITDAQRQKALDAAVAEDLHRGENGFSFKGPSQEDINHTSDMESLKKTLPEVFCGR